MLKQIIVSVIFLLTIAISQGQTNIYHSFPNSSFWRVDAWAYDNFTGCKEDYYYDYYFDGDTIINGSTHKKLFRSPVLIIRQGGGSPCYIWPWATFTGYMGAIKDDSTSNKSFVVFPNQSIDTMMFDYNLTVGDTIRGCFSNNCTMTISFIDSTLIGFQYRKRWNFNTCNEGPGFYIQGIGSDNGIIEWFNNTGFSQIHLICVQDTSVTLFDSGLSSSIGCQIVTSSEEISISSFKVIALPNPFSTQTTLFLDNTLKNAVLSVYNIFGQKVKQIDHLTGQTIIFKRDNLKSGLYFYHLIDCKKIIFSP